MNESKRRGRGTMPWFRVATDVTSDLKVRRLSVVGRWLWIAILAAARRSPKPGRLLVAEGEPLTLEELADVAGPGVAVEDVRATVETLERTGVLRREDEILVVTRWEEWQEAGKSTPRTRKHRDRKRSEAGPEAAEEKGTLRERAGNASGTLGNGIDQTRPDQRREENGPATSTSSPSLPPKATKAKASRSVKKSGPAEAIPGYRDACATWQRLFGEANEGARPTFDEKAGAIIKALLKAHGPAELARRMENYLAHHRAESFGADRFTLAGLRQRIDDWASPPLSTKRSREGLYLAAVGRTVRDPWGPCPNCPNGDDWEGCTCGVMRLPEVQGWRDREPKQGAAA